MNFMGLLVLLAAMTTVGTIALAATTGCAMDTACTREKRGFIQFFKEAVLRRAPASPQWVVRITLGEGSASKTCTGTVLAPHWILTSGHCTDGFVGDIKTKVRWTSDLNLAPTEVYNDDAKTFTKSATVGANDVGLVQLLDAGLPTTTEKVILRTGPAPSLGVPNPGGRFSIFSWILAGTAAVPKCTAATAAAAPIKQTSPFTVAPDLAGRLLSSPQMTTKLPCQGDSGAPWVIQADGIFYQIGIHSALLEVTGLQYEAARVHNLKSWIETKSGGALSCLEDSGLRCTEAP